MKKSKPARPRRTCGVSRVRAHNVRLCRRPRAVLARPSLPRMLWRGVRRRCAWCGGRGAFFTGWFSKQDDVPDVRHRVAPRVRGLRARRDGDQPPSCASGR